MKSLLFCALFTLSVGLAKAQPDNVGPGRAIRFGGVNDYIDLGNIYDNVALPVTLSAWIYIDPTSATATLPIFDSQDGAPVYNGFTMSLSTSPSIGLTYGDGRGENHIDYRRSKSAFFSSLTGRWIHVTGVISGATDMQIYLNGYNLGGSYQGNSPFSMNSNSPTETARIGSFFGNGVLHRFKGIIDELRIWNRALTEEEIRRDMCKSLIGNEPGLIGYWDFNETTGTTVFDKSNNHFNGQFVGNPQRVISGAPIGDESVFLYTNDWSGKGVSLPEGAKVTNIEGNAFGVQLYKVNELPTLTGGLPTPLSAPYFGVFIAHDNGSPLFDFSYLSGGAICTLFSRTDNSVATWSQRTATVRDVPDRSEFLLTGAASPITADLGVDEAACAFQARMLIPVANPSGLEFTWHDGSKQSTYYARDFGLYWVTVKNECGSMTDSVRFVNKSMDLTLAILGDDESTCTFQPRVLTPMMNPTGLDFTWHDGSRQSTFEAKDFGTYWVTIKNECSSVTDTVRFEKKTTDLQHLPPNVITPNGDTYNQNFEVSADLLGGSLTVYNRWGKKVYESSHYRNNWDGKDLAGGTYFYVLTGACATDYRGMIHILK